MSSSQPAVTSFLQYFVSTELADLLLKLFQAVSTCKGTVKQQSVPLHCLGVENLCSRICRHEQKLYTDSWLVKLLHSWSGGWQFQDCIYCSDLKAKVPPNLRYCPLHDTPRFSIQQLIHCMQCVFWLVDGSWNYFVTVLCSSYGKKLKVLTPEYEA